MSPFDVLGLPEDAEAPQIKRAYARLLRSHRPDDDPAAFQHLHDAYQACLQHATWRREEAFEAAPDGFAPQAPHGAAVDATGDDMPPPEPVPVPSPCGESELPAEAPFDAEAFIDSLSARLRGSPARDVDDWLQRHEGLYRLDRKHALRPLVVDAIGQLPADANRDAIDKVLAFFGLDNITRGDEWLHYQLDAMRRKHEDASRFEGHLQRFRSGRASWTDRRIAAELIDPPGVWRRLLLMLVPGVPGRVATLAAELQAQDPESSARVLRADRVRFWGRATDRTRLCRERLGLVALRLVAWPLLPALYLAMIDAGSDPLALLPASIGGLALLWLVYALATMGYLRLLRFNQTRLQWDGAMLGLAVRAVIGTALLLSVPWMGIVSFAIAGMWWVGARGDGSTTANGNQWATIATGLAALGFALAVAFGIAGPDPPMRVVGAAAALYSLAVLALQDVAWARHRRIPLQRAHLDTGWLWWLFGGHVVALVVLLVVHAR